MSAVMNAPGATRSGRGPRLDAGLLLAALGLLLIGLVMVASASVTMADRQLGQPFYYAIRQGVYIALGLGLGWIVLQIKLTHWERGSFIWLSLALGLIIGMERGWHERDEAEGSRPAGIRTRMKLASLGKTCSPPIRLSR